MQCPWCEQTPTDWDEMNAHMLKFHPEVTQLADFQETKVARIWATAVDLCSISWGDKSVIPKEETIKTFKYFLQELMKSEGK